MCTVQQKEYKDKLKKTQVIKQADTFNLEKETRARNPHKMDLATTANTTFKGHEVKPKQKIFRTYNDEGKPILA